MDQNTRAMITSHNQKLFVAAYKSLSIITVGTAIVAIGSECVKWVGKRYPESKDIHKMFVFGVVKSVLNPQNILKDNS